jgi:hypothetical protein
MPAAAMGTQSLSEIRTNIFAMNVPANHLPADFNTKKESRILNYGSFCFKIE